MMSVGAAKELTTDRTVAAPTLPRSGRAIEIAQIFEPSVLPIRRGPSTNSLSLSRRFSPSPEGSEMMNFEEHVTETYHLDVMSTAWAASASPPITTMVASTPTFIRWPTFSSMGWSRCGHGSPETLPRCRHAGAGTDARGSPTVTFETARRTAIKVRPASGGVLIHTGWGDPRMKVKRYGGRRRPARAARPGPPRTSRVRATFGTYLATMSPARVGRSVTGGKHCSSWWHRTTAGSVVSPLVVV